MNALALLLAAALSASAAPEAPLTAEQLARRSTIEYNLGDFEAASDDASAAYKLTPKPVLLFNLGQIQREMHHWQQAEFFYRGYLRERPDAEDREAVQDLIRDMVVKQQEPPLAPPVIAVPPDAVPLVASTPPPAPPMVETASLDTRSHVLSYTLAGAAAAGIVLAGVSIGGMADYQSYRNAISNGSQIVTYADYQSHASTAQAFNALLWVGIGLTVAGAGGAVLAW